MKRPVRTYVLLTILLIVVLGFRGRSQSVSKMIADSLTGIPTDSGKCMKLYGMISVEYDPALWGAYNKELNRISKYNMENGDGRLKKFFTEIYATSIVNFGYLEAENNNFDAAESHYLEGLAIQEKENDLNGMAATYSNLGFMMRRKGNTGKALDYYYGALKIKMKGKDDDGIATCYNNIAYVLETQGEYEKALESFRKSALLYEKVKDKDGMAISYSNIGALLSHFADKVCPKKEKGCYKQAVQYLQKAIKLERDLKDNSKLAGSLNTLGGIYFNIGDPECEDQKDKCNELSQNKARQYLNESLELREQIKDTLGLSQSYSTIAHFLFKQNQLKEAERCAGISLQLANRVAIPEQIRDAAEVLVLIYEKQNKYKEALEMYGLYAKMSDSISNETIRKANLRKQYQSEYEVQAAKDSVMNQARINEEKIKHDEAIRQQKIYTYGGFAGVILMLFVAGLSLMAYKNKKRANAIITEQKMLTEFQKRIIEEKQKELIDSINYAKRIQWAHLPNEKYISRKIKELKGRAGV